MKKIEPCLTILEVAHRLRLGENTVRQLIRDGKLVAINVGRANCGRQQWRVQPDILAAYEESLIVKPKPARPKYKPNRRVSAMLGL